MPRPIVTIEVPELLTVPEVADHLRVSKMTVRRLVADKKIASLRVGRSVRIVADSVGRYLASTTTGSEPTADADGRAA